MHSLQEQLEAAVRLHQSGDLARAQPLYERVLEQQPAHPDALQLYGVLRQQQHRPREAVEYIRRAIRLNPHSPLYHSNLAAALLETGNAAGAVSACRRALELDPRHVAAQANLGRACLQAGQLTQAGRELRLAVQQQPHDALLWDCLIHALEHSGDLPAALQAAHEATGLHAEQGGLRRRLAQLLAQSGQLEDARQQAEQATQLHPADAGCWLTLSNVLRELRWFDEAETACRQAVQLAPQLAVTHFSLAGILVELGRLSEAIDASHQGLELAGERPGIPSTQLTARERADVWFTLGTACLGVERFDEAIDALRRAHQIQPAESRIRLNLGAALREAGQLQEGEQVLRSLVQDHPDQAEALVNLGAVLSELGRTEEAIACCEQAIALEPDSTWARLNLARHTANTSTAADTREAARRAVPPDSTEPLACYELGNLFREEGQPEEALQAYSRAIAGNPAYGEARFNRSLALLSLGRLEEGWDEYEWRLGTQVPMPESSLPMWAGEPLENRIILVQHEQGIGDEVMFSSCLPDLLARAGHVMLECSPRLAPLFARSFPEITVHPVGGAKNSAGESTGNQCPECRIMAGSLPRYFRRSTAAFPDRRGWLRADSQQVARWQEQLHNSPAELVVGIAWRGGKQPAARRLRSTTLNDWSLLLTNPRLRVICLQYGDCTAELAAAREAGLCLEQPEGIDPLVELDEYAALLCSLDLIISVDNATVHLAGALGCEVWTLLPRAADWRWLQTGETSPWYPSMQLFRQPAANDWSSVFARVTGAVAERISSAGSCYQAGRFDGPHEHQPFTAPADQPVAGGKTEAAGNRKENVAAAEWAGRGLRHSIEGSRQEAISCWESACELEPETAEFWHGLGNALADARQNARSIDCFQEALSLDPQAADCWSDLGLQLQAHGLRLLREAGRNAADEDEAAFHRREELRTKARQILNEARECCQQAVELAPRSGRVANNLGSVLHRQGECRLAVTHFRTAVELQPSVVEFWINLANALSDCGDFDQALSCCEQALWLNPKHPEARLSRAFTLLRDSRFREGWPEYRWRFARGGRTRLDPDADSSICHPWNGEPLAGRTLRVLAEQGPGDQLMFATCLADLPADGQVLVECDARLVPLFSRSFPQLKFVPARGSHGPAKPAPTGAELQIPLGDLPRLYRNRAEDFPAESVRLQASPALEEKWRNALGKGAGHRPLIGIAWRGGEAGSLGDWRSTRMEDWQPVLRQPEPLFVSLQADAARTELAAGSELAAQPLRRLTGFSLTRDLESLAACLAALNLVITVDCTIAHLAALLGVETWILLPFAADWRWQRGRSRPLWYPTARLFRQQAPLEWSQVFASAAEALQHRLTTGKAGTVTI